MPRIEAFASGVWAHWALAILDGLATCIFFFKFLEIAISYVILNDVEHSCRSNLLFQVANGIKFRIKGVAAGAAK